jgi:hypothetical protein
MPSVLSPTVLLVLVSLTAPLVAQTTVGTGSIVGKVSDPAVQAAPKAAELVEPGESSFDHRPTFAQTGAMFSISFCHQRYM